MPVSQPFPCISSTFFHFAPSSSRFFYFPSMSSQFQNPIRLNRKALLHLLPSKYLPPTPISSPTPPTAKIASNFAIYIFSFLLLYFNVLSLQICHEFVFGLTLGRLRLDDDGSDTSSDQSFEESLFFRSVFQPCCYRSMTTWGKSWTEAIKGISSQLEERHGTDLEFIPP